MLDVGFGLLLQGSERAATMGAKTYGGGSRSGGGRGLGKVL